MTFDRALRARTKPLILLDVEDDAVPTGSRLRDLRHVVTPGVRAVQAAMFRRPEAARDPIDSECVQPETVIVT